MHNEYYYYILMKGTEVPNPRHSSTFDCTCCHVHSVLFLPTHSLLKGFRLSCFRYSILLFACHAYCLFLPMQSSLTIFLRYLCNLALAFLADFTAFIRFIVFSCIKRHDHSVHMSSVLHVQQFYTAGTPFWRHKLTYCQWPIIELTMNVSPKNKTAASHVAQNHIRVCVFRGVKNGRLTM